MAIHATLTKADSDSDLDVILVHDSHPLPSAAAAHGLTLEEELDQLMAQGSDVDMVTTESPSSTAVQSPEVSPEAQASMSHDAVTSAAAAAEQSPPPAAVAPATGALVAHSTAASAAELSLARAVEPQLHTFEFYCGRSGPPNPHWCPCHGRCPCHRSPGLLFVVARSDPDEASTLPIADTDAPANPPLLQWLPDATILSTATRTSPCTMSTSMARSLTMGFQTLVNNT